MTHNLTQGGILHDSSCEPSVDEPKVHRRPIIIVALTAGIFFPSAKTAHAATAATTEPSQTGFLDTVGHPDELHIAKLAELGIVSGYGDGLFGPEDPVTREQFAKMLVLSAGIEIDPEAAGLTFDDTPEISEWARPYVDAAVRRDLVQGVGNNRFAPKANVTRAQALTMIARALVGDAFLATLKEKPFAAGFADDALVPDWARPAVMLSVTEGIISLEDHAYLEPGKDSTRAMCCRYLSRFVDRLGWANALSESVTFATDEGISYTAETGLIVDVAAVGSEGESRLEVLTAADPPPPDPFLEVYSIYDIRLEHDRQLPEEPEVVLTFPVTKDVDVENAIILHEVDGKWWPAPGEITLTAKGLTLVTDHLSKYASAPSSLWEER